MTIRRTVDVHCHPATPAPPLETMVDATRKICSGLFEELPDLVLLHGGRYLQFYG